MPGASLDIAKPKLEAIGVRIIGQTCGVESEHGAGCILDGSDSPSRLNVTVYEIVK